ncbi:sugar isomerase domain-containing protein [Sporosarcina koreensis]|uniref:sugar isomerase domain-containing protein n=1 Tax=Sporosarcina koreensis TaxID=334735 RepID=UPI0007534C8C|nr:SIS domain-containing protein [Sporosarcina koreensis]
MSTLMMQYYEEITKYLQEITTDEQENIVNAAKVLADHIKKDKIFFVYGPGGHSNLAAQEVFFRAGGLMHASAILDEGTLLSGGALRSMAIERTPGYGRIVINDYGVDKGDLLIIVNAYGINTATIDAALEAKLRGAFVISVSSHGHATETPDNHPARHPSKSNLHDLADISIDSKVKVGDAVMTIEGQEQKVGAISTFVNAFILNSVVIEAVQILANDGISPPIWKSGNAIGGDEWNNQFIAKFKGEIKKL